MKVPATILKHPAVLYAVPGEDEGSDSKYWVFIKDDYKFTAGHAKDCIGGAGFNGVIEFIESRPKKISQNKA